MLTEIKRRPPAEQLALLEELAHTLREELASEIRQETASETLNSKQLESSSKTSKTAEELGWPPGYFEQTYGSLRDVPLERPTQDEYETREELD